MDKTEIMVSGSKNNLKNLNTSSVSMGGETFSFSHKVRNLGVILDENMSMDHAVSTLRQSCYYQLRKISQLRPLISEKATKQLVSSFVLSKIDYCNSLFYSTSIENIYKLLKVQNHAARLVKRAPKQSSVTAILVELHWLPVKARIIYKIAVVVFNLLSSEDSPNYLKELIVHYQP